MPPPGTILWWPDVHAIGPYPSRDLQRERQALLRERRECGKEFSV